MTQKHNEVHETSDRVELNELIASTAERLMPASLENTDSLSEAVLSCLCDYFDVSVAFYRRHDRENRLTILMAEWPPRSSIPDPDPLAVIHFDDNPVFAATEHLKSPLMLVPGDPQTQVYQEMIAKIAGFDRVTAISVPLLADNNTEGILGLVREGNRVWSDDEVLALQSIGSMFMQTQLRFMAEMALRKAAFTDSLTGVPNAVSLLERGRDLLASRSPVAVFQIDLEDLRSVNNTLGRRAGDKLIMQFANELCARGSETGWCGRINGNGFAVVLTYSGDEKALLEKARALFDTLSISVQIGERPIAMDLRMGVSCSSGRELEVETLFQEAMVATRSIDENPGQVVVLFDQALADKQREKVAMEIALRAAVESDDQIVVHYQPEVDLRTGKLVGNEALARWQHPELGLLAAGRFIEMAEDTGLVIPLSRKVLEVAIAQQAQWMREDPDLQTTIRVNVSPAQLMSIDMVDDIVDLLNKHQLPASSLCIEVTEHVVMEYSEQTIGVLRKLREQGVEVAIDDFGIGHSSLAKLKYMPADTLKIDRAFISSLLDSERDKALVDTIIRMAGAFDMTVVAEGVETTGELAELIPLNANRAQGYLFAKPMSADAVKALFHQKLFEPDDYSESPLRLVHG